jgi:hypothetical protein
MLAVENAEIGATMVALSIPALKPMFSTVFSQISELSMSATERGTGGRRGTSNQKSQLTTTNHLHPYSKTLSEVVVTAGAMNQSDDDLLTDVPRPEPEGNNAWSRVRITKTVAQTNQDRDDMELKDIHAM